MVASPTRASVLGVVSLVVVLAGCRVNRAPYEERHQERMAAMERRYAEVESANDVQWNAAIAQVKEQEQYLIPIVAGSQSRPVAPVWRAFKKPLSECEALSDDLQPSCMQELQDVYVQRLASAYFYADMAWVSAQSQASGGSVDLENFLAYSHNARLKAKINQELRHIQLERAKFRAKVRGWQWEAEQRSAEQRNEEILAAERERAIRIQAFANALQAAGPSTQGTRNTGTPQSAPAPPKVHEGPRSCTSDIACGVGYRCVKENFSTRGTCMQVVNEYGMPTYELPRTDSVGPKMPSARDCSFDTDCPIGFSCDQGSGACIKR